MKYYVTKLEAYILKFVITKGPEIKKQAFELRFCSVILFYLVINSLYNSYNVIKKHIKAPITLKTTGLSLFLKFACRPDF